MFLPICGLIVMIVILLSGNEERGATGMTNLRPLTLAAGMQEKFSGCIPISLISIAVFCASAKNFQRPHNEGHYPQRFQLKPKKQKLHYSSLEKKRFKTF